MDVLGALMFIVVVLGLYATPWIVAALRKAPHVGVVAVINVFLGWTVIGWFVALAMAFRPRPSKLAADDETAGAPGAEPLPASALMVRECPHCEQQMPREARACTHCQRDSEPWSKVGDRWWQLHDGPPHYWNEQTQQWTEAPLPASPRLVASSPVSHDAAGERRPGRRLLYLGIAIAAVVAAVVGIAAFLGGGSNDDAVARTPLEYHYRLQDASGGEVKLKLGDDTDLYLSSPDLPPGTRVLLTYELCATTRQGERCYPRPGATLNAGDWILDTWRLDAGEAVNGVLRLSVRIQGHEVAHTTLRVYEGS